MAPTTPAREPTIRGGIDITTIPAPTPKPLSHGEQIAEAQARLAATKTKKRKAKKAADPPDPPPADPAGDPQG